MLPRDVYVLCVNGAWIVGSYARYLVGEVDSYKDIDLIVPPDKWSNVAQLLPTCKSNKFGGWRFEAELKQKPEWPKYIGVDVWPSTLEEYFLRCKSKHGDNLYAVDFIHNRVVTSSIQSLKF